MKAKKYRTEGTTARVSFESVTEMVANARCKDDVLPVNMEQYLYNAGRKSEFTNYFDLKRVEEFLYNPPEASARIKEMIGDIESVHEFSSTRRRLVHRREHGDELDEVSWVRREPDGWRRMERVTTPRQVVRIAINLSVNSGRKPEHLYYRGAAAVALADAIEAAGHSVEVVAFSYCSRLFYDDLSISSLIEVVVKHPDQPVDIDTMNLVCGEIGFYRQIIFAVMQTAAEKETTSYLGRPQALPKEEAEKFDVVIDFDVLTREQAIETVNKFANGFEVDDL